MAEKTLVIGLGSQGYNICEGLVHKIEAEYGSMDRCPWVKVMAFETEQVAGTELGRMGIAKHMGISQRDYSEVLNNPENYKDSIDLVTWQDEDVLKQTGAVEKGASNIRMVGRLAFLMPENFTSFIDVVKSAFDQLSDLSSSDATRARGPLPNGKDEPVRFGSGEQGGLDKSDSIVYVFVVGSLTGGTASGGMVDVGYTIQEYPGLKEKTSLTGIFSIPPSTHTNTIHWANAYAALTEVNHFHHPRSRYTAKVPADRVIPKGIISTQSRKPYNEFFIVQPKSDDKNSLQILNNSIAEVVYLHAVSETAGALERRLVDAAAQYQQELDRKSRPLNYTSLGAAVIEFPVDHIIAGCASRLGAKAMGRILSGDMPDGLEQEGFIANTLRLEESRFKEEFVSHPSVQSVKNKLEADARAALEAAMAGDSGDLHQLHSRIDSYAHSAQLESNYAGEFLTAIKEAAETVTQQAEKRLDDQIIHFATDASHGPEYAAEMLRAVLSYISERSAELQNPKTDIGIYVDAKTQKQRITALTQDIPQKKGCAMPWSRNKKVQEVRGRYQPEIGSYITTSLKISSERYEELFLKQMRQRAELLLRRLTDAECGVIQWTRDLRTLLESDFSRRNEAAPLVNGLVLFKEGETIPAEYSRCLRTEDDERRAENEVLQNIADMVRNIGEPHDRSRFDRRAQADESDVAQIHKIARQHFNSLRQESVADRLVQLANWETEIDRVQEMAQASIEIDWRDNQFGPPSARDAKRRPSYIFFEGADASNTTTARGKIAAKLGKSQFIVEPIADMHKIVFIQGLSVFSAFSIRGVEYARSFHDPRRHSRADIAWKNLDGTPLDRHQLYHAGLLLTGFALNIVRRDQNMNPYVSTRPTPYRPAKHVELKQDLIDSSYRISREPDVSEDLRDQVLEKISSLGVQEAATQIDQFNRAVGNYQLEYAGKQIDTAEGYNRLLPFLHTVPGLLDAWFALYPTFKPPTIAELLEFDSNLQAEVYKCPRCKTFLGRASEEEEAIPEICPNPDCQWIIRLDSYLKKAR